MSVPIPCPHCGHSTEARVVIDIRGGQGDIVELIRKWGRGDGTAGVLAKV